MCRSWVAVWWRGSSYQVVLAGDRETRDAYKPVAWSLIWQSPAMVGREEAVQGLVGVGVALSSAEKLPTEYCLPVNERLVLSV